MIPTMCCRQHRLHIPDLDSDSVDLDLLVNAAKELKAAISSPPVGSIEVLVSSF